MAKAYTRVARTHGVKPSRLPLDKRSFKVTTAPVRLDRDVRGQNRKGLGDPYK